METYFRLYIFKEHFSSLFPSNLYLVENGKDKFFLSSRDPTLCRGVATPLLLKTSWDCFILFKARIRNDNSIITITIKLLHFFNLTRHYIIAHFDTFVKGLFSLILEKYYPQKVT